MSLVHDLILGESSDPEVPKDFLKYKSGTDIRKFFARHNEDVRIGSSRSATVEEALDAFNEDPEKLQVLEAIIADVAEGLRPAETLECQMFSSSFTTLLETCNYSLEDNNGRLRLKAANPSYRGQDAPGPAPTTTILAPAIISTSVVSASAAAPNPSGNTMKSNTSRRVFLSHASKDRNLAELLVTYIMATTTVHDKREILCTSLPGHELTPGERDQEEILEALGQVGLVFGLLTPNSLQRQAVMMELGAAWALKKRFIPILVGVGFDRIPEWLRTQAVRLDDSAHTFPVFNERVVPLVEQVERYSGFRMKAHSAIGTATYAFHAGMVSFIASTVDAGAQE